MSVTFASETDPAWSYVPVLRLRRYLSIRSTNVGSAAIVSVSDWIARRWWDWAAGGRVPGGVKGGE